MLRRGAAAWGPQHMSRAGTPATLVWTEDKGRVPGSRGGCGWAGAAAKSWGDLTCCAEALELIQ